MSGVYKSLQPKDVRSTPYRAHKTLITTFDGNQNADNDNCKVYEAAYSLSSSYNFYPQGITNIDNFNQFFTGQFETTTDGYYKTAMLCQADHLFYREYISNNKATLGGGAPISLQYRDIGSIAKIISFPTKRVGEGILPETVQITGSSGWTVVDDKYGNLVFSDASSLGVSVYDAADYDNVMISHTFNKFYKYVGEGSVAKITENALYGYSSMESVFTDVSFTLEDANGSVAAKFTGPSILQLLATTDQKMQYNMMNSDYSIALRIKVNTNPSAGTKHVVLAKQDKMNDVAVDLDGNLFTDTNAPSQYPFKLEVNSSGNLIFSKSDTVQTFAITSSAALTTSWKDVVIRRLGNVVTMYFDGSSVGSATDPFYNPSAGTLYTGTNTRSREQDCSNRSNLYIGNSYDGLNGLIGEIAYFHIFDRALTTAEISNLYQTTGWLGNFCGNVFYNLGIIVLTHPKIVNEDLDQIRVKGTVSMREVEVYCTVGPGDYNLTNNRSIQYWNPVHNQYEIDARYLSSSFRPYVTTIGLYNDNYELLAVAKLSTPIQTSKNTDTTFVVRMGY